MTITRARYFPAAVKLPDRARPVVRKYVVLASDGPEQGLWVFDRPDVVLFHGDVDWSRTVVPSDRQARNGLDVFMSDGSLAVVTVGGGCKCGALGRWGGPSWAGTVVARS